MKPIITQLTTRHVLRPRMLAPLLLAPLLLIGLSGCQPNPVRPDPKSTATAPIANGLPMAVASRDLKTPSQLIQEIAQQRVVLIGENHDRYDHHQLQLRIIQAMHVDAKAHGENLLIGMEFFQRPYQSVLDDYIAKRIDEAELLRRSEYFQRWRYDYRLYRPILRYARAQGLRVIALNASRELTNAVSLQGLHELSSQQRKQLPATIDESDLEYQDRLREVFDQHAQFDTDKARERRFAHFVEVQLVWDETMAETAAKHVNKDGKNRLALLAGAGHMIFRSGIPQRLQRRIKQRPVVVLAASTDTLRSHAADYLINTQPEELPQRGLMGILMEETDGKVMVQRLSEESAAYRAGARQGDIIISINGQAIQSTSDVRIALLDKGVGDTILLGLKPVNSDLTNYETEVVLGSPIATNPHTPKP